MENRLYGILIIAVTTFIYSLAFRSYKNENYKYSIALIMLGGLLLRLFTSMDLFLHAWDERYHALVAKNLLDNPFKPMLYSVPLLEYDYKNWACNHIWVHKQPVPIYTMALSMLLFGKNVIALRLPSILLSTMSIFATFKIGKILDSSKVGLLAAFLFSINGLIIEQTAGRVATDHIDVFFFSWVTISVYLLLRSVKENSSFSFILGAVCTGLAILTKWLPALIVLPIWLMYAYGKISLMKIFQHVFIFSIIIIAVVLPWQIYITNNFPLEAAWEYAYNKKHFFEVLGSHGHPFYHHFDNMRMIFGEIIYIPFIWLLVYAAKDWRKGDFTKFSLAIWILVPYIFFSFAATKMAGYILFTAAAMFLMTAMFFYYLEGIEIKYNWLKKLILLLLLVLPIRYSIERIKPFSNRERTRPWIENMKTFAAQQEGKKVVVFNCKFPIETMFHTDLIAYEKMPQVNKLKEIHDDGYDIYIDNHISLPKDLMNLDFVNYVHLTGIDSKN